MYNDNKNVATTRVDCDCVALFAKEIGILSDVRTRGVPLASRVLDASVVPRGALVRRGRFHHRHRQGGVHQPPQDCERTL